MDVDGTPNEGEGTRTVPVSIVDAFTDEPLAGNPAGVVAAEGLSEEAMQAVARELNASETAFLSSSDVADERIRYFTPTEEVDLCGHATIASCAKRYRDGELEAGTHALETNAGLVEIEIEESGTVWMTQEVATVEEVDLGYDRVADALGAETDVFVDVGEALPLGIASSGLPFLVVPVNFLESLGGLEPDSDAIVELTDELDVTGVYAFTLDTLSAEATAHGRMFAPGIGIPEDPVTGTASGAVGAYLRAVDAFDGALPEEMRFEQGHFVDRPGLVRVRARSDPVSVGGRAKTTLEGTVVVPEYESDDIIEV